MSTQAVKIKVFVASPGDLHIEREQLSKVINELNFTISTIAPEKGVLLELVKWETHAYPAMGRIQGVINEQIEKLGKYDIFIGIMWKRFGTPTGIAESGTEEEFRLAYDEWEKNKTPHILFYFCQAQFSPFNSVEEANQLAKVIAFRDELSKKGLVWDYSNPTDFADIVRPHLIGVLSKISPANTSPSEAAEKVGRIALNSDLSTVKRQIVDFAQEYNQIRSDMVSGDARTRKMEIIITQMRTLASAVYPLLPDLTNSLSAGQRLAAVAILQVIPSTDYLDWLAERIAKEKPFVGYHAAVALLVAVRNLDTSNYQKLQIAIGKGRVSLDKRLLGTDRDKILRDAERELTQQHRYYNPPEEIKKVGRKLKPGLFSDLTIQIEKDEIIIGLYCGKYDSLIATHIHSKPRMEEMESLYPSGEGYFAVSKEVANKGMTPRLL